MSDLINPIEVDRFWLEDAPIQPPEPLVWRRAADRYRYLVALALVQGEKVNEHLYRLYLSDELGTEGPDDHLIENHRIVIDRSAEPRPGQVAYLVQTNGRKVRTLGTKLPPFEGSRLAE